MTMVWEKAVVTAKEFHNTKNINDSTELNQPQYQSKLRLFNWEMQYAAASIFCEIVWKISMGKGSTSEWNELDRLFSPSPIATHANFRQNRSYRTGNMPEPGAIAIWKRGNSWQGHMAIVVAVSEDKLQFDIIEGRAMVGSHTNLITTEEKYGKRTQMPFSNDKLNLLGFIYPKNREIT